MRNKTTTEIQQYTKKNNRRRIWRKIVSCLACLVVFCTTYALILPAITAEKTANCDIQEHTHSESCYIQTAAKETVSLICTYDSLGVHTHTADCSDADGNIICEKTDYLLHEHNSSCYDDAGELFCRLPEITEHTASNDTAETHIHSDSCFKIETTSDSETLTCGLEESEGHVHSAMCYGTWELDCDLAEHTHDLSCYSDLTADVEASDDWTSSFADAKLTGVWADDVLSIAETQLGYRESAENYIVMEDGKTTKGYTRYGAWYGDPYGDWCAMFASFCLHYAGVEDMPLEASCQRWIEKLSDESVDLYVSAAEYTPKPGDLIFFDFDNNGGADHVGLVKALSDGKLTTIEGNSSSRVRTNTYDISDSDIFGYAKLPVQLTKEELAEVSNVISLIDALPSADEIDAKLAEFEEAEDIEGEEAYYTEISQQTAKAYYYYSLLSDVQKAKVTNAEKLMELEYIWSVTTLDAVSAVTVYQVNQYDDSTNTVLVHGGTVEEVIGSTMDFAWWTALIVEEEADGQLYVSRIIPPGTNMDKFSYGPETDNGFVLLVYINTMTLDVQEGDPVTVSFAYQTSSSSSSGLGTVNFGDYLKPQKDNTNILDIVESADTSELIEVNLYDFGSNINDLYNSNNKYPGFQQDSGTLSTGSTLGASSFNFGNNITSDLSAGIESLTNSGGDINRTASTYGDTNYGTANIPIEDSVSKSLLNGYPALADGTSLDYLFSTGTYATKQNTESINGLFRYNSTTGAYTFNSRENHAQFDASTNTFTLYKQIISSNFIMYPFGNFLPFNDITKQSAQASTIDRSYFIEIADSAWYRYNQGAGNEYLTLYTQLNNFISLMDAKYGTDWDSYDAVNSYFDVRNIPQSFSETYPTLHDGEPLMDYVYSIDYDEATDFFFSMEMKMNFMQPKDGLTGLTGKEPMVFYFTGDDDVWIYLDGALFLDLSGIHRHVGGEIDFVNGLIHYYNLDVDTGDVATTPYKTLTFEEAFREAFAEGSAQLEAALATLNENGTFKNYSTHSFNFYYMERGAGSGICRMNFNFPLLRQNSISVSKDVAADTQIMGDPDYRFQILKADETGNKSDELFIAPGTEYTIYDTDNNVIGTGTTDTNGVFTLKAGQRAEFAGIDEDSGKYYVRELLDGTVLEQYGQITVSGESTTTQDNIIVGSDSFTGMDSPVKDMSDGATSFRFVNDVDEDKLGNLTISKQLTEYSPARVAKTFDIQVKIDGELLPVGTEYLVGEETRTVETAGIITISADETAEISNILAGSIFAVKETGDSAEGYVVTYTEGGQLTAGGEDGVAGIINAGAHVDIVVRNSEQGTSVTIPGAKSIRVSDGAEHIYTLRLTEVTDSTGRTVQTEGITDYTIPVTVTDNPVSFEFVISYALVDIDKLPAVYYYRITEDAPTDGISAENNTVYIAEVTVTQNADGTISASVTNMWRGTMEEDIPANLTICNSINADFVNELTGSLTLSKTVSGLPTDQEFSFTVTLSPGSSGPDTLPAEFFAVVTNANAETQNTTVSFTNDQTTVTLKHGESITIHGLPYGINWYIMENYADDFWLDTEIVFRDERIIGDSPDTGGSIITGNTTVNYTNTAAYELPETGGAGTILYTMAGLMLMLCSAAFLLYRYFKRRREAY